MNEDEMILWIAKKVDPFCWGADDSELLRDHAIARANIIYYGAMPYFKRIAYEEIIYNLEAKREILEEQSTP